MLNVSTIVTVKNENKLKTVCKNAFVNCEYIYVYVSTYKMYSLDYHPKNSQYPKWYVCRVFYTVLADL